MLCQAYDDMNYDVTYSTHHEHLESGKRTDVWVSASLLISGIVGLFLFVPYIMYCCVIGYRDLLERTSRRRQILQYQMNV